MYDSVKESFPSFSKQFEGYVKYMYLDVKGLVTTGIGNLIDPVALATCLPFKHKDGSLASSNDIIMEWRKMKVNTFLAKAGHVAAGKIATLFLSDEDIDKLVLVKLNEFYQYLVKHYFPEFDSYPADAQLAILSMSWAMGPGFPSIFKSFTKHVKEQDWNSAANECNINTKGNPGLIPRNKANRKLLLSAAYITVNNLNPEIIYGLQSIGNQQSTTTSV